LEQPALMVNQQQDGVAGVDHPFVRGGHDSLLGSSVALAGRGIAVAARCT
jgi:hypothetical protein